MKLIKSTVLLFFAFAILTSCSSTVQVSTDYDKTMDFSKYKVFSMYKLKVTDNVSQLNQERIMNAIRNELLKKGFKKDDEHPDMLINVTAVLQDRQSVSSNTYGYGGYYRPYGWGGGMSNTSFDVYHYKNGSLIIDVVDAATEKLIWQGTGNKDIDSPSKDPDASIANAVAKILYTFPPSQKKK
jgi:hypothetical protein